MKHKKRNEVYQKGKEEIRRYRRRWKDNIEINFKR
jgi:hypothetical protein